MVYITAMIKSNLKVLLAMHDWTYDDLHEVSRVSKAAISRLASGKAKRYDAHTLNQICKALNCSLGDLLTYIPDSNE